MAAKGPIFEKLSEAFSAEVAITSATIAMERYNQTINPSPEPFHPHTGIET
jgi:hypothetical protein